MNLNNPIPLKVVVVGDSGVGKTALVIRLVENMDSRPLATIGLEFKSKRLVVDEEEVCIQYFDTAGPQRFRSMVEAYITDADVVLIVFDVTDDASFQNRKEWLDLVRQKASAGTPSILVANKTDLHDQTVVSTRMAEEWALDEGLSFVQTSSQTGVNVEASLIRLASSVLAKRDEPFFKLIHSLDPSNLPRLIAETLSSISHSAANNWFAGDLFNQCLLSNERKDDLWYLFLDLLKNPALSVHLTPASLQQFTSWREDLLSSPEPTQIHITAIKKVSQWIQLLPVNFTNEKPSGSARLNQLLREERWADYRGLIIPFICSVFIDCISWRSFESPNAWFQSALQYTSPLFHGGGQSQYLRLALNHLSWAVNHDFIFKRPSIRPPLLPPSAWAPSTSSSDDVTAIPSVSLVHTNPIGGGGFCDLYLGQHRIHGKVALKRPRFTEDDEPIIRRFRREADLWHQVRHQYILPFLGTCEIGPTIYMVSTFVENGDLLRYLRRTPLANRATILHQIAEAISYLHDMGIVHGDIKASNVLVSNEGSALLCDFGLSKVLDSMETSTEAKGRGTTRWMAPELFTGGGKTKESDVYAYGMTITEVLTGDAPFPNLNNQAVIFEVVSNNARPPLQPLAATDGSSYEKLWCVAELCWATDARTRPTMKVAMETLRSP